MKRLGGLIVALILLAVAPGCYNPFAPPPNQPRTGDHQLPIAFQHQQGTYYCSNAVVSMWVKYRNTPYPAEQEDVLWWVWDMYPWEVGYGGSLSPLGIQCALSDFSNILTEDDFYVGEAEKRQAVADIKKAIYEGGDPTVIIAEAGLHAMLVKGASWTQLATMQPSVDFITTADPWGWSPRNDTVGYWMQSVAIGDGSGQWFRTIHKSGQRNFAMAELADYDAWGGTYYGDPYPPDGCGGCVDEDGGGLAMFRLLQFLKPHANALTSRMNNWLAPKASFMGRRVAPAASSQAEGRKRVGPGRDPRHRVRREIYVPKPGVHTRDGLTQNLFAGLRQSKLSDVEGWEDLSVLLDTSRITLSSALRVESVSKHINYWLLTLRADGQPYARALLDDDGWLLSVTRFSPAEMNFEPRTEKFATDILAGIGRVAARVRLVHMYNNLTPFSGSADYHPLTEATLQDGTKMFVAENGSVFAPTEGGEGGIGFLGERRTRFERIR